MRIKEKEVRIEDKYIKWFSDLGKEDVKLVGGKAANLGEMRRINLPVPNGFAITSEAYSYFLEETELKEKIYDMLKIDEENTRLLEETAKKIRVIIENAEMPQDLRNEIIEAYETLSVDKQTLSTASGDALSILKMSDLPFVAVRSSATAEDSSTASFAGQQETFLNIKGMEQVIEAVKKCWASLFTARSIYYRVKKGFKHENVLIATIIQEMVNADKSGVIFSKNPVDYSENVVIEAVFGLGEGIVSGRIQPDQYFISKDLEILDKKIADKKIAIVRTSSGKEEIVKLIEERSNQQVLTNYEIKRLAGYAITLEEHYKLPQDIEFAIDSGNIYIVQTRPITTLGEKKEEKEEEIEGKELLQGLAASPGIGSGEVRIVRTIDDLAKIKKGDVLVTKMTNPDMVVTMQKSNAIVTDEGGMTSHASIVSREMGIPCFSGNTLILTNRGFMKIEEIKEKILNGEELYTLSFNINNLKIEWKKIVNSSKRLAKTITISVSKNGKVDWNTINTTPEHKFFSFEKRNSSYKEIMKIIEGDKIIYIARKIPPFNVNNSGFDEKKAYVCGAIFSDGYLRIQKDGTSSTVFVQKIMPEKIDFINTVCENFEDVYNYQLKLVKPSYYYCYRKGITQELMNMRINLDKIILGCSLTSITSFLSSIIDGDGNFIERGRVIKISFDAKDIKLLHSFVISCLRLGLNYRIRKEDNEFRFYIASDLEIFKPHLKRMIIDKLTKVTGDTYFSSRHLFSDISVPGRKGIKSFVKNNCLLSEKEILTKILPYIKDDSKEFLLKLINSDIGVLRVKKISENEIGDVFNIEVEDNNNYVVFTKFFTPLIVKNCVVGTRRATEILREGAIITVDGFKGKVYEGLSLGKKVEILPIVPTNTKIKVIVDLPDFAERAAKTNCKEVGLLRLEGIIAESGKHPYYFLKKGIDNYEEIIYSGISKIAEYFDELWVRTSDIRSDEFKNLEGAPELELNPMLGMHGIRAGLKHKEILEAEIKAMKKLAETKRVGIMMPQIIDVEEVKEVKKIIEKFNAKLKLGIMVETPAAVQIIESLCQEGIKFISFGTNDLTQFTLAIDRGNEKVQYLYNEMNPAVLKQLEHVIEVCKRYNVETSICGQAGSNKEMVEFLVKYGIDSISVNADKAKEISLLVKELEDKGLRGEQFRETRDNKLMSEVASSELGKEEHKNYEHMQEIITRDNQRKKEKKREEKQRHKVRCSECNKETEVPFQPDGVRPVYCKECFEKHKLKKEFKEQAKKDMPEFIEKIQETAKEIEENIKEKIGELEEIGKEVVDNLVGNEENGERKEESKKEDWKDVDFGIDVFSGQHDEKEEKKKHHGKKEEGSFYKETSEDIIEDREGESKKKRRDEERKEHKEDAEDSVLDIF